VPSASGKILVIRGGAIGDFILTLPVLTALRQEFPGIRLELLAYPRVAELAQQGGLVDAIRPIDARPMASFFAKNGPLPDELAGYFAEFAVIFSYLFDPDRIFQENVARVSKAQFIPGPHRPNENENTHATEVFLRPLQRLAIFDADPTPKLTLPPEHTSASVQRNGSAWEGAVERRLALHPGSGSERKNWPETKWAQLLGQLAADNDLSFLLVGGEAEGDKLSLLSHIVPPARLRLAQNLALPELAQQLNRCCAYIGHDSGISHLAAALGLRCFLLWGDTRREIWQPRSQQVTVLQPATGLAELDVNDVRAALRVWL